MTKLAEQLQDAIDNKRWLCIEAIVNRLHRYGFSYSTTANWVNKHLGIAPDEWEQILYEMDHAISQGRA